MGTAGAARVDDAALRALAREYETAASIVDGSIRNHLSAAHFGGSTAGRAYVGQGERVRSVLADVTTALRQWSRAAAEIATVLQISADRYLDADSRAAERVG